MTKVFVHGNPETEAIWDDLISELARRGVTDTVTLVPPGFGAPVPAGFGATQTEYRDWLLAELRAIPGDIDLVGHDWGAGHVFGALASDPAVARTWAADCAGLMHPSYVWHDAAQGWQTPGTGEEMVAGMVALDEETFAAAYRRAGHGRRHPPQGEEVGQRRDGLVHPLALPQRRAAGDVLARQCVPCVRARATAWSSSPRTTTTQASTALMRRSPPGWVRTWLGSQVSVTGG